MARRNKRRSQKKRTITPEHLAKMQAGRKRAKVRKEHLAMLQESGICKGEEKMSSIQRMLADVKR